MPDSSNLAYLRVSSSASRPVDCYHQAHDGLWQRVRPRFQGNTTGLADVSPASRGRLPSGAANIIPPFGMHAAIRLPFLAAFDRITRVEGFTRHGSRVSRASKQNKLDDAEFFQLPCPAKLSIFFALIGKRSSGTVSP